MWMNCPASITKAEGRTRPSSRFAKEGTAAHSISEMLLAGKTPPGKITIEGSEFIVGIPMLDALKPYIETVEAIRAMCGKVMLEQTVTLGWSGGVVWGTTDCVGRNDTTLYIADLKFGKGVPVKPDSAQLKIYALASWDTFWPQMHFDEVHMTICQPRLDPVPKTHSMSGGALQKWSRDELRPAVGRIVEDDKTEKAGDWCRWCVRMTECAAFHQKKNDAAANIFDDGVDLVA